MHTTPRSSKDDILTAAAECLDIADRETAELIRQRNALLIVVTILATMLTAF